MNMQEKARELAKKLEAVFWPEGSAAHQAAKKFEPIVAAALLNAEREALERAAVIAEEMNTVGTLNSGGLRDPRTVALDIAKAIRALAAKKE